MSKNSGADRQWVYAAREADIAPDAIRAVAVAGHSIALALHEGAIYAIDNRCPHMGFPLSQGSLECGILTCHWHHARFDLAGGGTFDPWADDARAYPVRIENGEVWVDLSPPESDPTQRCGRRLEMGLERNLSLIIAKSVIGLAAAGADDARALEIGALHGTRSARNGWGSGLTIMTAMGNILAYLDADDRPRALYQGLTQVAAQTAGQAPMFFIDPLQTSERRPQVLKRWLRDFVEVRNRDGAERTLRTAIGLGFPMPVIADMLFTAASDHRYLNGGHTLDFVNKAFELLDIIGWDHAPSVLCSLTAELTRAARSEESSSWRHPVDFAAMLRGAFDWLPADLEAGRLAASPWVEREPLIESLLADDPSVGVHALLAALRAGAPFEALSSCTAVAAARRIAHFRTSNEFGDWLTVLHTFTYANAVDCAMRRAPSVELLRAVFDGAVNIYLDRFLNMPPAPLPTPGDGAPDSVALLDALDRQQQVTEFAHLVSAALEQPGGEPRLLADLGSALLREDSEFHTFQMIEAAFRQHARLESPGERRIALIAAARYLAAHCPTPRASGQTYRIALRLHRGEPLYEES